MSFPDYSKGGCIALATGSAVGLWEVKNCTTFQAKYICRQTLGTPVNPELPAPHPTPSLTGSCPQGWSTSPKMRHCYKVSAKRGKGSSSCQMEPFAFVLHLHFDRVVILSLWIVCMIYSIRTLSISQGYNETV